MTEARPRLYPKRMPEGHHAAIQRYSASLPAETRAVHLVCLGYQDAGIDAATRGQFLADAGRIFAAASGPIHHDFSEFVDPQGFSTVLAIAYWMDPARYVAWQDSPAVSEWWTDPARETGRGGYFWEAMASSVDHLETIAFKEYVRGLSACPANAVKPMAESGYWGAARDRIPASAFESLAGAHSGPLTMRQAVASAGRRFTVMPPANMVTIRSGVSWADCGEEQLASYEKNVKPKLDRGMEYLRTHPLESGCCSLRQVGVIGADGKLQKEGYSLGYFLSLAHLEAWSHTHPTHLAIYTRAMMERKKYMDDLELRTYHEVYVINQGARFEYVNCHANTGLLPFQFSSPVAACPYAGAAQVQG